jgi:integrase
MARIKHQEGRIEERGKRVKKWYGHYWAYVKCPVTGKILRKHKLVVLGLKSQMPKWEAKDKLKTIIDSELGVAQTSLRPDPKTTFRWFVENRYLPMKAGRWCKATEITTIKLIRGYLFSAFGELSLGAIDSFSLQMYVNKLAEHGYSHSLVSQCHSQLALIMRMAHKMHFIADNPADTDDLTMPRTKAIEKPTATWEQIMAVLDNIEHPRDQCLYAVGSFCLLRSSEVFGLLWGSYRGDHFAVSSVAYRGVLYRDQTKTKASRYPVPIPDEIQTYIAAWHAVCPDTSPGTLMFPRDWYGIYRENKPPRPFESDKFFVRKIHPVAKRLEIPTSVVCFRCTRRTGATDLQTFGSLKDNQTIMRHANANTTLGTYIQPIPGSARAALNQRTSAVFGARKAPAKE